jgi:glycine oxidase
VKVIVIGAGIIGAAVADGLATRGADVTVLEMRAVGQGASQASAGMLAPFKEAHGDPVLLELGRRGLALFDSYIEALQGRTGARIEYARAGTLDVALTEREAAHLSAEHAALTASGVAADLLLAADVRACEPAVTARALAALLTHDHGYVGVHGLLQALALSARLAGAQLITPVEAAHVRSLRDHAEVSCDGNVLIADYVVIAAGCWSRRVRIEHVAALPVRPVRGQLLHLEWPGRPSRIVWGPACYSVPWSDGSYLVGATVEQAGFDEHATVEGVRALSTAIVDLVPGSAAATFKEVRVGLRPATPDDRPIIGRVSRAPRVVLATGHYRNGILLAPLTAQLVTNALLDHVDDPLLSDTTPDRFLEEPHES